MRKSFIVLVLSLVLVSFVCASVFAANPTAPAPAKKTTAVKKPVKKKAVKKQAPAKKAVNVVTPVVVPIKKAEAQRKSGIISDIGYGGGGGTIALGYSMVVPMVDLIGEIGYGFGSQYSFPFGRAGILLKANPMIWGLTIDGVRYSEKVTIPGLPEPIDRAKKFGVGIIIGREKLLAGFDATIGYSTVLGITANLTYKF